MNSWIGGYESIVKRMVPGNFDWFIHTVLFYHTKVVLKQQQKKQARQIEDEDEDEVDV